MSRLKMLLPVSGASTCNKQQPLLHCCEPVAQHKQHTQQAELRELVDAVAAFHGFTPEQTAEAQQIAAADHVAALECFRTMTASHGITVH